MNDRRLENVQFKNRGLGEPPAKRRSALTGLSLGPAKTVGFVALTGCLLSIASGCGSAKPTTDGSTSGEQRLRVVATVGMVADVVREVGGDRVEVTQIMGAGVDPHLYKSTRDDVQLIMRGDLVFYSGLMLEGKMVDTLVSVARQKPVYAVTAAIAPERLLEPEGFGGHDDPHVWMDVSAWQACVGMIAERLAEQSPGHAAEFQKRAEAYVAELSKLHQYGIEVLATVPESRRVLITSHDAFNYFGKAYGLQVRGVQGISTESEAGLQRINELVDLIVDQEIPAVFVESSVPRKSIEALIDGARSRGHDVRIGGELYSDAMGPEGTYEGTYIGMLDHNITVVARALGGIAPELGLNGRLSHP